MINNKVKEFLKRNKVKIILGVTAVIGISAAVAVSKTKPETEEEIYIEGFGNCKIGEPIELEFKEEEENVKIELQDDNTWKRVEEFSYSEEA